MDVGLAARNKESVETPQTRIDIRTGCNGKDARYPPGDLDDSLNSARRRRIKMPRLYFDGIRHNTDNW